jgi:hypothetical protein
MSDSLGDGAGDSTEAQARLYERWAQGGTAVSIITSNLEIASLRSQ